MKRQIQKIPRQPESLAYMAGLIDGEGYISVLKIKRPLAKHHGVSDFRTMLVVKMCDPQAVEWIHRTFGGTKSFYEASEFRTGGYWRWTAEGNNAAAILKAIYPYLRVKKRLAALFFKFRKIATQGAWKRDSHRYKLLEELCHKVRQANRRGPHSGAVETAHPAPNNGVKIQSELSREVESGFGNEPAPLGISGVT